MAFWMIVILLGHHGQERAVLAFILLFAAVYHAELILTTLRQGQLDGMEEKKNVGHAGSAFVVCVWAALTIGVLTYFADAAADVRSGWVVGLAAIAGLLGFGLGQVSCSLSRLGLSHRIAAAGLLVLSIPIATSGVRVEVGWMILAVAFAATWRMGGSRIARMAAPVVWLLAVLHIGARAVGLFDESFGSTLNGARLGETWLTVMGVPIGSTPILAWMAAIAGHVVAALITPTARDRDERWLANARLVGLVCGLIWLTASIYGLPNLGATVWIIAYGWMLIAADVCGVPVGAPNQAAGILLIATIKWAAADTLAARLSHEWTQTRPVLNSMMGVGALVTGSLIGFYRLRREAIWKAAKTSDDPARRAGFALGVAAAAILLMTAGLSIEIDRTVSRAVEDGWAMALLPWQVRQLAWTILWSLAFSVLFAAAAVLGVGTQRGRWLRLLWRLARIIHSPP
jgi:hypothetical protein